MSNDNNADIEFSSLCGSVMHDDVTVLVQIYRLRGSNEGWSLEVIDEEGGSTAWTSTFATDKDAYAEFYRTLEREGVDAFALLATGKATTA